MGVIRSAAVAPETRGLTTDEAERFDAAFAAIREMATECLGPPWVSLAHGEFGAASGGLG